MKVENKFRETSNDTFSDAIGASVVTGLISAIALIIAILNVKLAFAFLLVAIIYILSIIRYKQMRKE
jgi:predicted PurR-regulated permease PerM